MQNTPNPKCPRCKCYWKPDENDIKSSGLVYKSCKKCRENTKKYYEDNADKCNERTKKYYKENADEIKERNKKWRENNADKIKENKKKYYEDNADEKKERCKKYYEENRDEIRERKKKYNEENSDKIKEYNKKYYEDNADKIKEYKKKYREDNPDKVKEGCKKYREQNKCKHNKRYGTCKICNIQLYLINLQRSQLRRCLKYSSLNKTKSSIEYLGCDADYFIEYMKKKMDIFNKTNEVKMDFDNIHIDHIKPITAFDLNNEDEFLDCCNYTNLQPLLAQDNLFKKNKWTDENDMFWNENIINKEYLNIYIC